MSLKDFPDLLQAAQQQAEPQRLLLVFAAAELPHEATDEEKAHFERGEGGALAPALCVDKLPQEVEIFAALVDEAARTGIGWDILFVATMSGRRGVAPNSDEAVQPLKEMVEAIKSGHIGRFLAVSREGELVQLQ